MKNLSPVNTLHPPPLRWLGDNIAMGSETPALITLVDRDCRHHYVDLAEALHLAGEIDDYGLQRITSAAAFAFEKGYFCAADAEAWRGWVTACQ